MRVERYGASVSWLGHRVHTAWQSWQKRLACNSAECADSRRIWRRISNHDDSVHLQGMRYCFPECFESELSRRLEQLIDARPERPRTASHRVPLGLLMLSRGDLESAGLRAALDAQRQSGHGRIGEWIGKMGIASEQQITAALAAQWACPLLTEMPQKMPHCPIPFPLLRHCQMAPVHYVEATRVMHVAFSEGIDYPTLFAIEQVLQCKTGPCFVSSRALESVLAQFEEKSSRTDQVFGNATSVAHVTRIVLSYASTMNATQVRLARCASFIWLRLEAKREGVNLLFRLTAEESTVPA